MRRKNKKIDIEINDLLIEQQTSPVATEINIDGKNLSKVEDQKPDTVLKTIGTGGPVPIKAPKHDTIQLQPIVVPLAVVPYMTHDSDVLRTDEKESEMTVESISAEPVVSESRTNRSRLNSLGMLVLGAICLVPFILAYFYEVIQNMDFRPFNAIGIIEFWSKDLSVLGSIGDAELAMNFLAIIAFCAIGLAIVVSLVGLLCNRFFAKSILLLDSIAFGSILACLIYKIADGIFFIRYDQMLVIVVSVLAFKLIVDIVTFFVVAKRADRKH